MRSIMIHIAAMTLMAAAVAAITIIIIMSAMYYAGAFQ